MGEVVKFKKPPTTVRAIIAMWPTMTDLAEDIEVEYNTVQKWKERERIPSEHFQALLDAAKKRRIKLKAEDLIGVAAQ